MRTNFKYVFGFIILIMGLFSSCQDDYLDDEIIDQEMLGQEVSSELKNGTVNGEINASAEMAHQSTDLYGNQIQRVVYDKGNHIWFYPLLTHEGLLYKTKDEQRDFIKKLNRNWYGNVNDWELANLEQMMGLMESMTGTTLIHNQVNFAWADPSEWFPMTDPVQHFTMGRTVDEWAKREDPDSGEPWIPTVHESIYGEGEYHWGFLPDGEGDIIPPNTTVFDDDLNYIADDDIMGPSPHKPGLPPWNDIECSAWIVSLTGPRVLLVEFDLIVENRSSLVAILGSEYLDIAEQIEPESVMYRLGRNYSFDIEHFDVSKQIISQALMFRHGNSNAYNGEYSIYDINDDGLDDFVFEINRTKNRFGGFISAKLSEEFGGIPVFCHRSMNYNYIHNER